MPSMSLGLGGLRHAIEFRGPMSDQAFASLIYGWYGGLVYFTPMFGGWIADRWLGTRTTVVLGALLMSAGHLAMSFDQSFLIALALLIVGSGCLKGNISAQVGQLYPRDEESRRTQGFTIFSAAINIGAVAGPLAAARWRRSMAGTPASALAAALMILALVIYLRGQRHLARRPSAPRRQADAAAADRGREAPHLAADRGHRARPSCRSIAYSMIWNIGIVWIDAQVSLATPLRHGAGVVVQLGRQLRQHRRGAAAGRAVGVAGAARRANRGASPRSASDRRSSARRR